MTEKGIRVWINPEQLIDISIEPVPNVIRVCKYESYNLLTDQQLAELKQRFGTLLGKIVLPFLT